MKQPVLLRHGLMLIVSLVLLTVTILPVRAQTTDELYSSQELAQMLAPIALYPDALLTQILIAATYPIEVIEADRWLQRHPTLDDDDLDDALYDKEWDPSVKALCHFPSLLSRMSEEISETTNLGNAFLAQEGDVMAMVQQLRAKAYREGNLYTTRQQNVVVENEVIVIEPVRSRVVYIPYYDPAYVYGNWWYPDYPPYYWSPANVRVGLGVTFSSGISLSFAFSTWSYFDWPHRVIYINPHQHPRFVHKDRHTSPKIWKHAPTHRRGVAYRDKHTAREYGQTRYTYPHSTPYKGDRGYRDDDDRQHSPSLHDDTNRRRDDNRRNDSDSTKGDRGYRDDDHQRSPSFHDETNRRRDDNRRNDSDSSDERKKKTLQPPVSKTVEPRQPVQRDVTVKEKKQPQIRQTERALKSTQSTTQQMRKPLKKSTQKQENVFEYVDDGRNERQSSQRGKTSRQKHSQKEQRH
nr:DUF3300 domain-containing protein [uncultured Desulfuromonas sp.]